MTAVMDRRHFLRTMGGFVVATAAGPVMLDVLMPGGMTAAGADVLTDPLPAGTPICVLISLDGGNDSLNTLVPVNDPWYFDAAAGHGSLALTGSETLALDGSDAWRLHPNLTYLANRSGAQRDVAFVLGVGERVKQNFSHFDSMAYWQTADLSLLERTGWLGRYNDKIRPASPLASVALGDFRADVVGASAPALVVRDTSEFHVQLPWLDPAAFRAGLDKMATLTGGPKGAAATMISSTFAASARVEGASDPAITGDGEYPWISKQLLQAALLIRAGLPSQTYVASLGGFDSHEGQRQMQADRFTELNDALTRFFGALAGHTRERDVFVVIYSEFGRQATLNKSGGTDHGQAGMAMFVGGGVTGGFYGMAPTLDPGGPTRPNRIYDALKPTVDFRSVHATVLTRLAGDPAVATEVLRGTYENLGVFGAAPPPPPPPPANVAPKASFTAAAVAGATRTWAFDARASSDSDGTIVKYRWNFGDGTSSTGAQVQHAYAAAGNYTVNLNVIDDDGARTKATRTITV